MDGWEGVRVNRRYVTQDSLLGGRPRWGTLTSPKDKVM